MPPDDPRHANPHAKPVTDAHIPELLESPDESRPASAALPESLIDHHRAEPHDPYAAWRHPTYSIFAFGTTALSLGTLMVATALNWQVFQLTHLERTVGWLGLVQALPVICLSLVAGHVADTFRRTRVMLVAVVLLAMTTICLVLLTSMNLPPARTEALLLTLAAAEATASAFFRPARNAVLPGLLPTKHFPNAVTWNSTLWEVASVGGPAIAGFLIARDIRLTYAVAAILQVVMIPTVLLIAIKQPSLNAARAQANRSLIPSFATLIAGVKFVVHTRQLLAAMTLDLFAVLFGGVTFLLPIFAEEQLHVGPTGFGFLRCAPSIGAVFMALYQAHSRPMRRAGYTLLFAVTGFGLATIVFAFSRNYWLSLAMLALTGAFDNVSVVIRHTLVQLLTPDEMRGRVSAVNNIFIGSSNEIGGLESGLTAAAFGIVISAAGGGILSIVTVAAIAMLFPELRKLGSLGGLRPVAIGEQEKRGIEPVLSGL